MDDEVLDTSPVTAGENVGQELATVEVENIEVIDFNVMAQQIRELHEGMAAIVGVLGQLAPMLNNPQELLMQIMSGGFKLGD